jgi:DNA polymerase/3'-5' exonuclease PolX
LEEAQASRVWAYRKAAWAMDDLEQDVELVFRTMGRRGLESLKGVAPALAGEIETLLQAEHTGR